MTLGHGAVGYTAALEAIESLPKVCLDVSVFLLG
jgi:hypothetical protein